MSCPICHNTVKPGAYCPECGLTNSTEVADDFARYLDGYRWGETAGEIFADNEPDWAGLALMRVANVINDLTLNAGHISDELRAVIDAINSARLGEEPDDGA